MIRVSAETTSTGWLLLGSMRVGDRRNLGRITPGRAKVRLAE